MLKARFILNQIKRIFSWSHITTWQTSFLTFSFSSWDFWNQCSFLHTDFYKIFNLKLRNTERKATEKCKRFGQSFLSMTQWRRAMPVGRKRFWFFARWPAKEMKEQVWLLSARDVIHQTCWNSIYYANLANFFFLRKRRIQMSCHWRHNDKATSVFIVFSAFLRKRKAVN